jgi:hypothetical protein
MWACALGRAMATAGANVQQPSRKMEVITGGESAIERQPGREFQAAWHGNIRPENRDSPHGLWRHRRHFSKIIDLPGNDQRVFKGMCFELIRDVRVGSALQHLRVDDISNNGLIIRAKGLR